MAKARKVTMAGDYLSQAAEALRATGSAETLYRDAFGRRQPWERAIAQLLARGNRLEYSRTAILFSAVAAEAYVNHFIAEEFSGKDADGLDRLRTVDKFLFATRLVTGREVFRRDRQPIERLTELFELRNELMHPKSSVRIDPTQRVLSNAAVYRRFNPERAAKFLISVAEAAVELTTLHDIENADHTALMVFDGRDLILRHGKQAHSNLPSVDAKPVQSFAVQTIRRYKNKQTGRTVIELAPDPKKVLRRSKAGTGEVERA